MIYRSTLDPALRMEEKKLITEAGAFILATLAFYLTITPGVLGGFVDYYILRPLLGQKRYTIDDFVVGDKLGEGGFGVVYRATGVVDGEKYVLKQCKDYGEAEIWTNSRLQRACPQRHRDLLRRVLRTQELQGEEPHQGREHMEEGAQLQGRAGGGGGPALDRVEV